MVERHDEIRAEVFLDGHRTLGGHHERRTVDVRAELDALLGNLGAIGQTENLKPTAIGENRPVPTHHFVEAA